VVYRYLEELVIVAVWIGCCSSIFITLMLRYSTKCTFFIYVVFFTLLLTTFIIILSSSCSYKVLIFPIQIVVGLAIISLQLLRSIVISSTLNISRSYTSLLLFKFSLVFQPSLFPSTSFSPTTSAPSAASLLSPQMTKQL